MKIKDIFGLSLFMTCLSAWFTTFIFGILHFDVTIPIVVCLASLIGFILFMAGNSG